MVDRRVPELMFYTRDEFVNRVWDHKPGEHVTIIGRTGSGKTTLGYQLFAKSVNKRHPGAIILSKPKDETTDKAVRKFRMKRTRSWPPRKSFFDTRPATMHVLQPRFTYKDEIDRFDHEQVFKVLFENTYQKGHRSVYAPDLMALLLRHKGLETHCETAWLNWRSNQGDIWVDSQKSTHIPLLGFNQATHLILFRESDKKGRERFDEIGGFENKVVERANMVLPLHHSLYINQAHLTMCVVGP